MDDTIRRRKARLRAGSSISLDDVAAYARVSTASVSRVLNGVATVSADVRLKVEQACEALGYVPNGAARALAASRTMTIGAVVPTIENVGFATAVSTLQSSLKSAGYTLLLASSNYEASADAIWLPVDFLPGLQAAATSLRPSLLPSNNDANAPGSRSKPTSISSFVINFFAAAQARMSRRASS
jgi:LacI family transcriptional regulator